MFSRGFKTWCENTSVGLRRELDLGPADPLDPNRLARRLDIVVWRVEEVPGIDPKALKVLLRDDPWSWSAVTVDAGGLSAIILNSAHSKGRTASDLTHELAHRILGHEPARMDVSEDGLLLLHTFDRAQEEEANWLSGCLLLPRPALLDARRRGWTPADIAKHHGVSKDMAQYRMRVTGVERQMSRRQPSSTSRRT